MITDGLAVRRATAGGGEDGSFGLADVKGPPHESVLRPLR